MSLERATLYRAAVHHGLFAVVPVLATAYLMYLFRGHLFATDFHRSYWPAANDVLHGRSPYIDPRFLEVTGDVGFAYPAVGALALAPFGLLTRGLGGVIFTALNVAAVPLALRLLGVRDWRTYGIVFLWLPVISAWQTANITLLLVLGVAVVWRYRDRPLVAGAIVALLISIKPFAWPLGLWLLATRRYAALARGAACGLVLNAVAWGVLGFHELHRYQVLLQAFARQGEGIAFTAVAFFIHLGAGRETAYILGLVPGVVACLACLVVGRRGDDRRAMVLCIAAMLFTTSIVWLHYFALLIVALALTHPRFSAAWTLPMLMSVCIPVDMPATWQIAVSLVASGAVIAAALRTPDATEPDLERRLDPRMLPRGRRFAFAAASSQRSAASPLRRRVLSRIVEGGVSVRSTGDGRGSARGTVSLVLRRKGHNDPTGH